MMDPDSCNSELRRIIDQSIECASRLEDLLQDERNALELQDVERLRSVTTSKERCVQCLEGLESERRALCAAAGYEAIDTGMTDMLSWCDKNAATTPLWNRLVQNARQCEALNRTNGAIGRVRYEHVVSALALLSEGGNPVYSPDGQQAAQFGRRALAHI